MEEITTLAEKSDAELVQLSLANQYNFLYLIKRYQSKLLRYIRRISGVSAEDAEDILQEVLIKVYYKLNDFDQDLKFSSWIYRITHNQVISHYRKTQARPQTFSLDVEDELIKNLKADLDIKGEVDLIFLRQNIFKIINHLPQKCQDVLVLRYFEDKNYQEISDILKLPLGTVATLINKGKKLFKEQLIKKKVNL